jgi:LPXTG-motif cell wall-anchored protein
MTSTQQIYGGQGGNVQAEIGHNNGSLPSTGFDAGFLAGIGVGLVAFAVVFSILRRAWYRRTGPR